MSGFGLSTLAVVTFAGLAGPVLAWLSGMRVPVVIGEVGIGLVLGRTGFGVLDPAEPTFALLGSVGFALVMFVVGTHVPVTGLRGSVLPVAALRAGLVGIVAVILAAALEAVFQTGHVAVYAVLMASSSAALALPILQASPLRGAALQVITAQIAIADTVCIVALPLVINPGAAMSAAAGAVVIAGFAAALVGVLRAVDRRGVRRRVHRFSEDHRLALELRTSLVILFTLGALAAAMHVSVMLAGFALGVALAVVGEPRRMARQLFGVTEGFFAPLFFVWLGASLQVRELLDRPAYLWLGVGLGVGAVVAHCATRVTGQPLALGALSAAQLGVPIAAATLGTEQHLLSPGEPSALMLGALVTIAAAALPWPLLRVRHG